MHFCGDCCRDVADRHSSVEPALQHLHLAFAPDKCAETTANRRFKSRGSVTDVVEAKDLLLVGFPLDGMFARETGDDQPLHQAMRRLAHEHRIRLGQRLKTRREVYGVAEDRDRGVSSTLDLSDHRWPGVEANPQLRSHAVFGFEVAACCL